MFKIARVALDEAARFVVVNQMETHYWVIEDVLPAADKPLRSLLDIIHALRKTGFIEPASEGRELNTLDLLAPLDHISRNIFCVGKNYHEHAREFAQSGFDSSAVNGELAPEAPVVFTKPDSTIIGPFANIPRHANLTQCLDYEAELGVVIGTPGSKIKAENAMAHVFGYTIINDVTARDLQKQHRQWFLGKSLDGFCPMGPYIVTADQLDGQSVNVRCWVNGQIRQAANTRDLIFGIPQLIETISAGIALRAGDVIATGTPAGVGISFSPPRYLSAGDVVKIEIEGVGMLENQVAVE